MVYIDDYNSIERVKISEAVSHITTRKHKLNILAQKSEAIFEEVSKLATDINMRVNPKKTQLLCVHANHNNEVKSHIRTSSGTNIESTSSLKILGFHFSKEPNAVLHVTKVIERFYSKLWTLRFLRKSGMSRDNLLKIYKNVLRPSVEYSNIIYHSLIPEYISDKLESVQKQAIKIIFGWDCNYSELLDNGTIETLKSRRVNAIGRFANKVSVSPRFGPNWFKCVDAGNRQVRQSTRNLYIEPQYRLSVTAIIQSMY